MFIDKWPTRLGVALRADRVLIGRRLQVVVPERAVRVVAVRAAHRAFVHLVVEWHAELRLHVVVALEAKRGLRRLQQLCLVFALVDTMAARAADIRLGMRRALKVRMRARMTLQARLVDLFGRVLAGVEYLCDIPAAIHVRLAWTMAALAARPSLAVHLRDLAVRIVRKLLRGFLVAGRARLGAHKLAGIGLLCLSTGRFISLCRSSHRRGAKHAHAQQQHGTNPEPRKSLRSRINQESPYWPFYMHQIPPWVLSLPPSNQLARGLQLAL